MSPLCNFFTSSVYGLAFIKVFIFLEPERVEDLDERSRAVIPVTTYVISFTNYDTVPRSRSGLKSAAHQRSGSGLSGAVLYLFSFGL